MLNKTEESSKNLFDISFNKSYQKMRLLPFDPSIATICRN